MTSLLQKIRTLTPQKQLELIQLIAKGLAGKWAEEIAVFEA